MFTVDSSTKSASVTNGVATASLTGLTGGSHTVSAAYTSSNGYASGIDVSVSLYGNADLQSISFTAPTSPVTYGVVPVALKVRRVGHRGTLSSLA